MQGSFRKRSRNRPIRKVKYNCLDAQRSITIYLCQYTARSMAKLFLPDSVPVSAEYLGRSLPSKVTSGWCKHVLNPLENHIWKGHPQHMDITMQNKTRRSHTGS